jgi:hypothetical protein
MSITFGLSESTDQRTFTAQGKDPLKLIRGYSLDHIFGTCCNLQKLTLFSFKLFHCHQLNRLNNLSIVELVLDKVHFYKDMLPELSSLLPSLKVVSIVNRRLLIVVEI